MSVYQLKPKLNLILDGWATDDLVYIWQKENPVQIGKVSLPRFVIEKYSSDYCNVATSTGIIKNTFTSFMLVLDKLVFLFVHENFCDLLALN